jgi:hypothetical protein
MARSRGLGDVYKRQSLEGRMIKKVLNSIQQLNNWD